MRQNACIYMYSVPTIRGVHPPEAMMHFPLFQISALFPKNIWHSAGNFPDFTFSRRNFRFSSAKISDFFTTNFQFPYFPCFTAFSPYFAKIIVSPYFKNFTPFSLNLRVFTYFICTSYPPTFTMMHLCITQCRPTYWTPLPTVEGGIGNGSWMLF